LCEAKTPIKKVNFYYIISQFVWNKYFWQISGRLAENVHCRAIKVPQNIYQEWFWNFAFLWLSLAFLYKVFIYFHLFVILNQTEHSVHIFRLLIKCLHLINRKSQHVKNVISKSARKLHYRLSKHSLRFAKVAFEFFIRCDDNIYIVYSMVLWCHCGCSFDRFLLFFLENVENPFYPLVVFFRQKLVSCLLFGL